MWALCRNQKQCSKRSNVSCCIHEQTSSLRWQMRSTTSRQTTAHVFFQSLTHRGQCPSWQMSGNPKTKISSTVFLIFCAILTISGNFSDRKPRVTAFHQISRWKSLRCKLGSSRTAITRQCLGDFLHGAADVGGRGKRRGAPDGCNC